MKQYISKITSKIQLTNDVIQIFFEKPDDFNYKAGQYVQVFVPGQQNITTRSYSLTTAPHQDDLGFCIKVIPEGIGSQFLDSLFVGQEIEFRGPIGHFVTDENAQRHFFIATGVGISPMLGMISELLSKNADTHIYLLFGLRYEDNLFYADVLDQLQDNHPNFSYHFTLSKPGDNWEGLHGRVTAHLNENHINDTHYICGSREMVIDVRKQLLELGADSKNIKFEIF